MTDFEIKYNHLANAVKVMLAAQADARNNKSNQQKWIIAKKREQEVRDIMDPPPKISKQSQFEFLAR